MKRDLDNYVAPDWEDRLGEYREEVEYGSSTATSHSVPETRTARIDDGREVSGDAFHVFEEQGSQWKLRRAVVFADGLVYGTGIWWSLFEYVDRIREGEIRAEPPQEASVEFYTVGASNVELSVESAAKEMAPEDLIADIYDRIDRLNDRPDSTDRCIEAAIERAREPTDENRLALEEAFEAVPTHERRFMLGDMDHKDYPIRGLLADSDTDEFDFGRAYILDRYD